MRPCDQILEQLDAAVNGSLPDELAAHLKSCASCQAAVARAQGLDEAARVLSEAHAPAALVARLKTLPRLAPACEEALILVDAALAGDLEPEGQNTLLQHVNSCDRCRVAWEAFATLREVGIATVASARLRARLAVPTRLRVEPRRQRARVDLRLATAAAYLVAALTVLLIGDPARLARASSAGVEKASLYARAAVENRLQAYGRWVGEEVGVAASWLGRQAREVWATAEGLVVGHSENRAATDHVKESGNGG